MSDAADPRRFPFTEPRVRAIPDPPPGVKVRYRDAACPGLAVRAMGSTRAFIYYAKDNGRPVELRLGTWPALTVEAARRVVQTRVAPAPAAAAESRRAIREESTLAELWAWFMRHHVAHLRASTRRRYDDSWRLHLLPALGAKRLSAIRRSDVQSMADKLAEECGNGAGRHACAVLSAMYHSAARDEALSYKGDIPTAGIRRPKVASRARFLQPGELPAFLRALSQEPEPWRLFWSCCLFVGLRRGNVASARWSDLALDIGQWLVPEERSKTGAMLTVPIPGPVLDQLKAWREELPGLLREANDKRRKLLARGDAGVRDRLPVMTAEELTEAGAYVFPSALVPGKPTASLHITDPKASWRRLLLRAKLANLRPHDLRRSIGSWMALGGVGLPIIGAALGHKDQRSTAVYARLNDGAVRAAMNRATDAMLEAGKPTPAPSPEVSRESRETQPEGQS
jgi:integrase